MLIHASTVALDNKAVLITGAPGAGKSDLALRLIMEQGAVLVSDDQTALSVVATPSLLNQMSWPQSDHPQLIASPAPNIAGMMEIRHVGLRRLPYISGVPVALYVELVGAGVAIERLPETETVSLLNISIPRLILPSFEASTPAKIRAALIYPPVGE